MLVLLLCLLSASLPAHSLVERNDAPIIGILTQETSRLPPNMTSYLAASYVKYVESAGGRVVPITIYQSLEHYTSLFNSLNGVIFPGGASNLITSGYARSAKIFYQLALEANTRGDYFPIWGTCLGFEELTYLTSGRLLLSLTNTRGIPLPMVFTNDPRQSRMFGGFPPDLLDDMAAEPISAHVHKWSVTSDVFENSTELNMFYRVLSVNSDETTEFVSTMEAYNYPIYGTLWHPEKNAFEWTRDYIPHSPAAIKTTFFMADFFVNEARKNFHKFNNKTEEDSRLIYNYSPLYSSPGGSVFEQKYYFP
ncbi:gamma-glutamyl hydrolase [Gadus morhua]|nr:gamma-glutamyl hydrolase-like [Gadus morhua]